MITLFFIRKISLVLRNKSVFSRDSPDGNEKPGAYKCNFSCTKKATERSSFWGLENTFISEDL
jgi:hypothetical protein